jgi:glycosyltransferase involved in cell wall biosynthesis
MNARPLRVAVLDHTAELGGAELALIRLLDALPPEQFDIRVVLFSDGPLVKRLVERGHALEVVPLKGTVGDRDRHTAGRTAAAMATQALSVLPFAWRLGTRLRALDVDLIHTTSLKADLIGVPVSWLARRPLVWHVHDRISPDYLPSPAVRLIRALARRAPRAVIANSEATAVTLPGVRRLTVAHPGLAPEQVRAEPAPPPPTPVVGILGRISETKGQLEFVRAAAQVLERHPEARFRIVGSALFGHDDYEERVRSEAAALGLDGRIEFAGFVSDPAAALDALTVCVHASGTPEPFGQVVLESMARGVPVVATRGGGVTEIIEACGGSPLGLLVAPHDVPALAAAIVEVLERPEAARQRASEAREHAVEHFSIAQTAAVVGDVWSGAAGRGPARTPAGPKSMRKPLPGSDHEAPEASGNGRPTVAVAHDYLTQRGGAERVVLAMLRAFPGAPIYTTLYDPDGTYPEFRDATVVVSPLNRVGPLRRNHRAALPLLPLAARSLHIPHDVVVASSSGWAHGFPGEGRRLVYCHAPARWLYQSEAYLGGEPSRSAKGWLLLALRPWLLFWDRRAARRADRYLANSTVVRERIRRAYGIDAQVVFPPHSMDTAADQAPVCGLEDFADSGYFLVVSRLLPYKNVHPVVAAFRGLEEHLVVVGAGPMADELRAQLPDNARLVSGLDDARMRWVYAQATALIAPSLEDFGLTPLEAGAFGKPTLALRGGGYLDTVIEGITGSFFDEPTPEAIATAVADFRSRAWDAGAITRHTRHFSEERFQRKLRDAVADLWDS